NHITRHPPRAEANRLAFRELLQHARQARGRRLFLDVLHQDARRERIAERNPAHVAAKRDADRRSFGLWLAIDVSHLLPRVAIEDAVGHPDHAARAEPAHLGDDTATKDAEPGAGAADEDAERDQTED